jgi:hypothetical protein
MIDFFFKPTSVFKGVEMKMKQLEQSWHKGVRGTNSVSTWGKLRLDAVAPLCTSKLVFGGRESCQ